MKRSPEDPVEALLTLVEGFAKSREGMIAILRASGQPRFKIHVSSLIKAKRVSGVTWIVEDLLGEINSRKEYLDRLEDMGIRIVIGRDGTYVEVPAELLYKLC